MIYLIFLLIATGVSLFWVYMPRKVVLLNGTSDYRSSFIIAFIACLPILIIFGLRSNFGDTPAYIKQFYAASGDPFSQIGNGYNFFLLLYKLVFGPDAHYSWWFFSICFVSLILFLRFVTKYSPSLSLSLYWFICIGYFCWLSSGIRQFLAVCIMLGGFRFVVERKFIPYLIVTLIAVWFHISAIIMLPVFFMVNSKPWSAEMLVKTIGTGMVILLIILIPPAFDFVFKTLNIDDYLADIRTTTAGSILRIILTLIPVILALIRRRAVEEQNDPVLNIAISYSVIAVIVFTASAISSGIYVGRLGIFFDIINVITYPYILVKCLKKDMKILSVALYFIFFFIFFFFSVLPDEGIYVELLGQKFQGGSVFK